MKLLIMFLLLIELTMYIITGDIIILSLLIIMIVAVIISLTFQKFKQ